MNKRTQEALGLCLVAALVVAIIFLGIKPSIQFMMEVSNLVK